MVYLREIIQNSKMKLDEANNIELAAYLALRDKDKLNNTVFDLTPQEEISLKGFKGVEIAPSEINNIISKRPLKGVDATSNIYKFAGLYAAASRELEKTFAEKFA